MAPDPSDQIRGHSAAAIARLEPYSRGTGVLVEDAVMAAIAVASYEINLALGALRRLSPPPQHRGASRQFCRRARWSGESGRC